MPVLHQGDSMMVVLPASYSPETVARNFDIVEEFSIGDVNYWTLLHKESVLIAVAEATTSMINHDDRHRVVASLSLVRHEGFSGLGVKSFWQEKDLLQVEGVVVEEDVRNYGLATRLYEYLVIQRKIVLMSDDLHYRGGKALWQHIAKKSQHIAVYVLDSASGKFYPYDGSRVRYDGVSIDEQEIWSQHPDLSCQEMVLIAEDATKHLPAN
ncbi:hypothetical protein [Candidatus Pantoea multigeneris]|uniref:N-acetyltransferase n=1 Tax=Candidatus Pantoea multigeneris TaxID=2608357 RepID=A0ABX0RFY0_9GAMM|nr:hypothetical protein [Pantoea multigeneris]NIF24255.1 hypothetical protein [Pantoea multigeneris]